jgi:hypothetical protein
MTWKTIILFLFISLFPNSSTYIPKRLRKQISAAAYSPPPPVYPKVWVDRVGNEYLQPVIDKNSMKIVTWNVLGPLHGESTKHSYAETKVVLWSRRRDKLVEELRDIDADILCLQGTYITL